MKGFVFNKEQFFKEADQVYKTYPSNIQNLEQALDSLLINHLSSSAFSKKALIYSVASQHADVTLFPSCPFYFEIDTGRDRNSVTSTFPPQKGLGCWLMKKQPGFIQEFDEWSRKFEEKGLMISSSFTDTAHHYANCENVLKYGFSGIRSNAIERLKKAQEENSPHGIEFLESIINVCEDVIKIAGKFSQKAYAMLEKQTDELLRSNLKRIALTANRVPQNPPETFYEALSSIIFTREVCNALDGLGFAIYGHIDRLLYPYYENDLSNGRINSQEAQEFIDCFISLTDARWDLSQELPGGTNADVVIGGCHSDGRIIYNDITKMITSSYIKHKFANPKLQARISKNHPKEYFECLAQIAGLGLNVLSIFNDDVIIRAQCKSGKPLKDSRLYLAGGCQEITLSNEVNCRAYAYINLPQMLQPSLFPEEWSQFYFGDESRFVPALRAESFKEFYQGFLRNFRLQIFELTRMFNYFGSNWKFINPALLFSATFEECIETMKDVSEGGAKYNTDCFAVSGIGTLIDSLFSIYYSIYFKKIYSMDQLKKAIDSNFENDEIMRQYLINQVPKFCMSSVVTKFGRKVIKDISACLNGIPNSRGGEYEASLFAYYSYEWFKDSTFASANGRQKGVGLSRGANPSESTDGIDAATLLYAQKNLDYSDLPGGAVTYMDLPLVLSDPQTEMFSVIIRLFLENGGSIMDFNVVSKALLKKAQKDPENHKNIVVRVCGYSALFYSLSEDIQNEIINRLQR